MRIVQSARELTPLVLAIFAMLIPAGVILADVDPMKVFDEPTIQKHIGTLGDGCMTQLQFEANHGAHGADGVAKAPCEVYGPCDFSEERDSWTMGPGEDEYVVRVYFNIFCEDNWTNPAVTVADIEVAMDSMNAHYAAHGISFVYDYRFINDSRFRDMDGQGEFNVAKATYAVNPVEQCNVFVGTVHDGDSYFSYGCFPWDPDCLTVDGGIMMNRTQMPPYNFSTLTHEMGHNLGLWHTHHGVSEVSACGVCYEFPHTNNHDDVGDFCSDTYPTPITWSCSAPTSNDPCSFNPWGPGEPNNIMSYSPSSCRYQITVQQGARARCWLNDVLSTWKVEVDIASDVSQGPAPLEVNFTSSTNLTVDDYSWDFGDGNISDLGNPTTTYEEAGLYNVRLDISSGGESFFNETPRMVWVQGDTLEIATVEAACDGSIRFDVFARNSLPVYDIEIPFTWAGEADLSFDSATTTGLRTEGFSYQQMVSFGESQRVGTYRLANEITNEMPPGEGAVLSLWFTCEAGASVPSPIAFISYASYEPGFASTFSGVSVVAIDGALEPCLAGDVDGDGTPAIISDLVFLVDYMFAGGAPPPSPEYADCDGSGGEPNIADVVYLVAFMFNSGPPPICVS